MSDCSCKLFPITSFYDDCLLCSQSERNKFGHPDLRPSQKTIESSFCSSSFLLFFYIASIRILLSHEPITWKGTDYLGYI